MRHGKHKEWIYTNTSSKRIYWRQVIWDNFKQEFKKYLKVFFFLIKYCYYRDYSGKHFRDVIFSNHSSVASKLLCRHLFDINNLNSFESLKWIQSIRIIRCKILANWRNHLDVWLLSLGDYKVNATVYTNILETRIRLSAMTLFTAFQIPNGKTYFFGRDRKNV